MHSKKKYIKNYFAMPHNYTKNQKEISQRNHKMKERNKKIPWEKSSQPN